VPTVSVKIHRRLRVPPTDFAPALGGPRTVFADGCWFGPLCRRRHARRRRILTMPAPHLWCANCFSQNSPASARAPDRLRSRFGRPTDSFRGRLLVWAASPAEACSPPADFDDACSSPMVCQLFQSKFTGVCACPRPTSLPLFGFHTSLSAFVRPAQPTALSRNLLAMY